MAKILSMDLRSRAVAGRPRQRAYPRQSRMGTKTSLTTTDTLIVHAVCRHGTSGRHIGTIPLRAVFLKKESSVFPNQV
jgi:hypothetical protein